VDDDRDGLTDCDDAECAVTTACVPGAEDCLNGIDDDRDGETDCDDGDCAADPRCAPPVEDCGNGSDDDGDGDTDCGDAECADRPECSPPAEDCTNGVDDDGDGDTDCDDSACAAVAACIPAAESCTNGVDDDGDGETDCDDSACAGDPGCVPPFEDCGNRVDDDGDRATDCEDDDCTGVAACAPPCDDDLDPYEENDDVAGAADAAAVSPGETLYAAAGDADVFAIPACRGGTVTVDVSFAHAGGDIDIRLVAGDGSVLAESSSGDDDEHLAWTGDRRGTVYLVVAMYTPGGCNAYRLTVDRDDDACITTEIDCRNGVDDDDDGLLDCEDTADCSAGAWCMPETDCRDRSDDDGDGAADCLDPGCVPTAACTASGNDTCETPFVLPADPEGPWYGDTSGMARNYRGTCAGDGPEAVFRFDITAHSRLTVVTRGSDFDTVLYLRAGDCAAGTQVDCNDDVERGTVWSRIEATLEPGAYFLFVDGWGADSSGPYVVTFDLEAAKGGGDGCP
jgi:hypothetical protein